MANVLDRICADKRQHITRRQTERPLDEVEEQARAQSKPRGFLKALESAVGCGAYGLIAEIKKASPSQGVIREKFDPPALARAYQEGGATCLSVLTDFPYFQGSDSHLAAARGAVSLPAMRKDFLLDPYQIVESRGLGADCVLLIMAALSDEQAAEMEAAAFEWGMDVLVEVHDADELQRALRLKTRLVGINNRNLKTLETNLATTEELARWVPEDHVLVCESGLFTPFDLARMSRVGANCFLIGESLMRKDDVAAATRALLARPQAA